MQTTSVHKSNHGQREGENKQLMECEEAKRIQKRRHGDTVTVSHSCPSELLTATVRKYALPV